MELRKKENSMVSPPSSVLRPRMDYCTGKRTLARVRPRTWHFLLFSIATPLSFEVEFSVTEITEYRLFQKILRDTGE